MHSESGYERLLECLESGDYAAEELAKLISISCPTVRKWIRDLKDEGEVFYYQAEGAKCRIYTLDASKHAPDGYERAQGMIGTQEGIIPGARVFLIHDRKREEINREIMRSQRTKSSVRVYPGTSFGDVALRMP